MGNNSRSGVDDVATSASSFNVTAVPSMSRKRSKAAGSHTQARPSSFLSQREWREDGDDVKDVDAQSDVKIEEPDSPYAGLTVRAVLVGILLGAVFNIIVLNLALTSGIIPSLNICAGLLGFFLLKTWVKLLSCAGCKLVPNFTVQENTVVQTATVACYGLAFYGGFSNYVLGMTPQIQKTVGDLPHNTPDAVVQPEMWRLIPYQFCIALIGVFMLISLREVFIVKYNLVYPSGTATGIMIESFHGTAGGAVNPMQQIKVLGKWLAGSFLWAMYKWFFSAKCGGFAEFPTFGLQAAAQTFLFDFALTYVGVGMISPYAVTYSMMIGAIIGHGILQPCIAQKAGDWFPEGLGGSDFRGPYGYITFISISVFVADGIYNIIKIAIITWKSYSAHRKALQMPQTELEAANMASAEAESAGEEAKLVNPEMAAKELARKRVFQRDSIPWWVSVSGYCVLAVVGVIVIPFLYTDIKWYMVLVGYLMSPFLAIPNCYACGMTDWNMASLYGKLAIFMFAAWGGTQGGVIAGLGMCGVLFVACGSAADLMQDFRTGYITMAPPRAMLIAQVLGATAACFISPAIFFMFNSGFVLGDPNGPYKAPFAAVYRTMALIGVGGVSVLPKNCLLFCLGFAIFAILLNLGRDFLPKKFTPYIPIPSALGITIYLGAYVAVDMMVGAVSKAVWGYFDPVTMEIMSPIIASGMIAGEGIWSLPAAILGIAKLEPPIAMCFSKG